MAAMFCEKYDIRKLIDNDGSDISGFPRKFLIRVFGEDSEESVASLFFYHSQLEWL